MKDIVQKVISTDEFWIIAIALAAVFGFLLLFITYKAAVHIRVAQCYELAVDKSLCDTTCYKQQDD
jgi:hypothetical protein